MPFPVYNGTTWANSTPQIYDGAAWKFVSSAYVYNGTAWQQVYSLVEFDKPPGSYQQTKPTGTAIVSVLASKNVTWKYVVDANVRGSISPANNGISSSLTVQCTGNSTTFANCNISSVFATYNGVTYGPWTITTEVTSTL